MMKSKQDIEKDFEWWITCIPDKINRLEELIPSEVFCKLDYSLESLRVVGEYLCGNFMNIVILKQNAELWDCFTSYVGTTYRRNVPTAEWHVELDDYKNVYYGVPALRTSVNTNFYPKFEISTMLERKRTNFLESISKRHIELQTLS